MDWKTVMEPIVAVIQHYHPEWEPPTDTGYEWVSCHCFQHDDANKSASVSFVKGAFHCFACPAKGDIISLIRQEEGCSFAEAERIAERISQGEYVKVSQSTRKQRRRRIFTDQGSGMGLSEAGSEQVPTRIRW